MSFKRRALEILAMMREMDTDDAVHAIQIQRQTGWSRSLVVGSMVYLEDVQAVVLHLDERGRHCWTVAVPAPDEDSLPDPQPAALFESLAAEDDGAEVLASLRHGNDLGIESDQWADEFGLASDDSS